MPEEIKMDETARKYLTSCMNTMVNVLANPVGFYRSMPKEGGLIEPLMFMIAMGILAGLLRTILGVFGLGAMGGSFLMALTALIITPIVVTIFGFVAAAILFGIWKLAGSQESFETAFRCSAYASAISPACAIFNTIPYIGGLASIGWMTYLMVVASVEVHGIEEKKAWIIFGVLGAILAIGSLNSEIAARRMMANMGKFQKKMGNMNEMSPEEAGKHLGEFLKGMQEGAGKPK